MPWSGAVLRTSQLRAAKLRAATNQKRWYPINQKFDRRGSQYYVRSGSKNTPRAVKSSFQINNLLLDLDAEGSKNVRPYTGKDHDRIQLIHGEDPRTSRVAAKIRSFQSQLKESRGKTNLIFEHSSNPWRLTPHSVLSAALLGAPGQPDSQLSLSRGLDGSNGSRSLHLLASENGISPQVAQDDTLFLEWMFRCFHQLQTSDNLEPSTDSDLKHAIQAQDTITGIRRLASKGLYVTEGVEKFGKDSESDLPKVLRDAIENLMPSQQGRLHFALEAGGLIGNIVEGLLRKDMGVGPHICGLGLRLSAEVGAVEDTAEYLDRGFQEDLWTTSRQVAEDATAALSAFIEILANNRERVFHTVPSRQELFQLITGIEENDKTHLQSLRTLALDAPKPWNHCYTAYISILGRLGAIRTIWKEWHTSARSQEFGTDTRNQIFENAIRTALEVAEIPPAEARDTMTLGECVTLDYHSIDAQQHIDWTRTNKVNTSEAIGDLVAELRLPVGQWLETFAKARLKVSKMPE